jgi:ArsR family metal-binding transcriptional regulator
MFEDIFKNLPRQEFQCQHAECRPRFTEADEREAQNVDASEVRRRWPRFDGRCPDCGEQVIMYASAAHYVAGDW